MPEEITVTDSILNSVKKLLGLNPEITDFDVDILMNINAAIFTLTQLGVGPKGGFTVSSAEDTYASFLGEGNKEINQVKMYLYYKTRLSFDPPTNASVLESLKEAIKEAEWRLNLNVEVPSLNDPNPD